jgi:hypothetical protein
MLPYDSPAQSWLHAAARAVDWLEAHLDQHDRLPGDLHDLGAYYKWPLFLWSIGRFSLAKRMLETVVTGFMSADGDFRTGVAKSADPLFGRIADSYTNTWPLVAARAMGRREIGEAGLACLRSRQVSRTGGFLTGTPGQHADRRQDIVTVAGCGNAFLAWGDQATAKQAGDCLLRILELQRDRTGPFRFYLDGDGRLLRDLEITRTLQELHADEPGQAYVYPGMAAVFLARLFAVTDEARYLAGSREYFAVTEACGDRVYQGIGCCKTGWAAATLYRLTGEEKFRHSTRRAAAEITSIQRPEGNWATPDRTAALNCDVTGEMGYHLTQYALELAGGGGR